VTEVSLGRRVAAEAASARRKGRAERPLSGHAKADVKARGDHRKRSETVAFVELGTRQPDVGDKTVIEIQARDLLPIVRDIWSRAA
jgi:hypothetical protein